METRYTVRQAVEMTGVKSYVLRYWEEELELRIHRNELGHRYYTGYDIQLFMPGQHQAPQKAERNSWKERWWKYRRTKKKL